MSKPKIDKKSQADIEKRIKKSYKSRLKGMKEATDFITAIIHSPGAPENITVLDMADLRDAVFKLGQYFHEFNAYVNSYNTLIGKSRPSGASFGLMPNKGDTDE